MRPHDDEMIVWWCDYIRHHYFRSKLSIFPFLTKAWPTYGRTDGPTNGRTDQRTDPHRGARTHLKRQPLHAVNHFQFGFTIMKIVEIVFLGSWKVSMHCLWGSWPLQPTKVAFFCSMKTKTSLHTTGERINNNTPAKTTLKDLDRCGHSLLSD